MPSALNIVQRFFPAVSSVKDAARGLTVVVRTEDNKGGRRNDHNRCALAKACRRQALADGVIIAVGTAYIIRRGRAIRYRIPEAVRREIIAFDRKGSFEPGRYELQAPPAYDSLGQGKKTTGRGKARRAKSFTRNIRSALGSAGA